MLARLDTETVRGECDVEDALEPPDKVASTVVTAGKAVPEAVSANELEPETLKGRLKLAALGVEELLPVVALVLRVDIEIVEFVNDGDE